MANTHKHCTSCLKTYPIDDFYIEKRKPGKSNYNKPSYVGIPDTHRPTAMCKRCKDRQGRWGIYRQGASKRNLTFNLDKETFYNLLEQDCHYCGRKAARSPLGFNGIDRVDNSIGYESDNVVACCETCNKAKRDLSVEDWNSWKSRLTYFSSRVPFKLTLINLS